MTRVASSPSDLVANNAQAQLQQIVDHTSAAMFVKDLDGRFLFVNREFERMKGMPVAAIVGCLDGDLFPAAAAELHRNDRQVVEERRAIDFEEIVETAQGRRTYLSHKFPLFDAAGQAYAVCCVATDITERKRSEEALRAAALAVTNAEGEGVFRELVRYLATILEVDVAMIAVFADSDRTRMRTLAAWLDGKALMNFEYALDGSPCRHVIGREFHFVGEGVKPEFPPGTLFSAKEMDSYAALPLNDSNGVPLGLIATMDRRPMRDAVLAESMLKIFAMRAVAEIERTRAEAALRASEASYRAIFEASEDEIFVHDWDTGAFVDANPKACCTYGYSVDEFRCLSVAELSSGVPPYAVADAARWIEKAKGGEALAFEWHRKHRDGSLHWGEVCLKAAEIAGTRRILAFTREITARKAAEDALRASEEQYRAIFNASADALVLWNSEYRRVDVNTAYERLYGWSRDEVIGRSYEHPAFSPEYARPRLELVRRALAGEACHTELVAIRKNGERVPTEVRAIPFEHRGQPHVLTIARDITERKRAEHAISASEEQYRAIFGASVDGLLLKDADHRIVDVNDAFASMHGYRRDEMIGRQLAEFIPAELQARCAVLVPEILAGVPCHIEARTHHRDGTLFDVEIHGVPMRYQGREHALVVMRDVTERKRADEALRASEEQYRAIFNASADALVLWNSRSQRVDVNPAYERMYGYSRDEVLSGARATDLPSEYRRHQEEIVARTLAGEHCHEEVMETFRRTGGRFPIEVRTIPIQHRGEPHVLAMIRDLTERRQVEDDRARLEAQLRQAQKMEAIGHLTGGIAHDFNNLLTGIMGYVTLAAERSAGGSDDRLVSYLEQAYRSCERARDLIQQMLTFSRGRRSEPRPIALAPLIRESVKLLRSSLPATVALETDLDDNAPPVLLDPVQLGQVLMNLAINARDAMRLSGEIRVAMRVVGKMAEVCTSCRKTFEGNMVELSVSDSGPGIAADVQERMFEPFFTTKEVGQGSGMGLSTVHGIVHEHGGHVVVENSQGAGACFRVLLPALRSQERGGALPRSATSGAALPRAALFGRVAVIDDEASVASFMNDLLAHWGLEVTTFVDARAALDSIAEGATFDLVITDQTMPGMTGIEFARAARSMGAALPIVLYTGYDEGLTTAKVEQAGVAALVRKPIDPSLLLAVLEKHLPRPITAH